MCLVLAYFIEGKLLDVSFFLNYFAARNSLRFKYLQRNEFKFRSRAYIHEKLKSSSIYPTLTQTYSHMLFRRYFDEIGELFEILTEIIYYWEMDLTFDGKVECGAGGVALPVLCPARVSSVLLLPDPLRP
jgi:hypothetical protein